MACKTTHALCQKIITKCLSPDSPIHWGKEIRLAKKIVELYPDESFWDWIIMTNKPVSLSYFLCPQGLAFLANQFDFYKKVNSVKHVELEPFAIGPDKTFAPNKKTLLEFLRK